MARKPTSASTPRVPSRSPPTVKRATKPAAKPVAKPPKRVVKPPRSRQPKVVEVIWWNMAMRYMGNFLLFVCVSGVILGIAYLLMGVFE